MRNVPRPSPCCHRASTAGGASGDGGCFSLARWRVSWLLNGPLIASPSGKVGTPSKMRSLPASETKNGSNGPAGSAKVPPIERPEHSLTHKHRRFCVRQYLVCHTAKHSCG